MGTYLNMYMISYMNKFYINLLDDHERRQKFLGKAYHRWEAVSREEVPEFVDKKMISFYNFPRKAHLGRCGCFCSHVELLKYIANNELNNCLIVEDDAVQVKDLPKEYPRDAITYVGGFFHNIKMMDNSKVNIDSKEGLNALDPKYRILMTLSYIIPNWKVAKEIVDYIDARPRYKAIDIMLGNIGIPKYYEYPACFVEEGSLSTISKKTKKSNDKYEWVKI
jgi:GR25 family glycosyltransferase involved in LPS biosynthesis